MRSSLFAALPSDLIQYISHQYLNLNGPSVTLIEGEPSDEEKKRVTATALHTDQNNTENYVVDALLKIGYLWRSTVLFFFAAGGSTGANVTFNDGKADSHRPDLSTYHLIAQSDVTTGAIAYKIGFCKKKRDGSLEYTTHTLYGKSPLLRYVREDLSHRKYSQLFPWDPKKQGYQTDSHDRVLLRYLETEVKAAGGLTCHRLRNRTRLAPVSKEFHAIVAQQSILQELFKDLCDHESFHELEKARDLLEHFPKLLRSEFRGDIIGCAPELTFHDFTIIQKAYLQGNWLFYEMALDVIEQSIELSEDQKAIYKEDLLAQIEEAKEGRLQWTLDNLLNKGVRIIDADTMEQDPDEAQRLTDEIVKRNGYHLIIKKEADAITSCTVGYRCPTTQEYKTHDIVTTDPLFAIAGDLYQRLKQANDGYGNRHTHCFTRDHRDLALVRAVLEKLQVPTRLRQTATPLNFEALLAALQEYSANWAPWSVERCRDHLHGAIYAECRLFSGILWQLWMSKHLWTSNEKKMGDFVSGIKSGTVDLNFFDEGVWPLSSSLGDKFRGPLLPPPRAISHWLFPEVPRDLAASAFTIYLACRDSKADRFHRRLTDHQDPERHIVVDPILWTATSRA